MFEHAGEIASVQGTVMDFLQPHKIGERYQQVPGSTVGYDHNYCLSKEASDGSLNLVGRLIKRRALTSIVSFMALYNRRLQDPSTKNSLTVYTNQPCVQLYMGGYLDMLDEAIKGLDGNPIKKYSGVCLETQIHPDAINQV